jgi:hypothetical protein
MTDTPQHIHDLQLELWLKKSPEERLRQFIKDNEALILFGNLRNQQTIQPTK